VLIVGAGPAGLMSARLAMDAGLRVMLVDDGFAAGGSLLGSSMKINNSPAQNWVDELMAELQSNAAVTVLLNSVAWAYREHNLVVVTERAPNFSDQASGQDRRTWRVRARHVVVAAGAIERLLVFANNDRPGVMLCSAVRTYINRYAVAPGKSLVLFTNNSHAYQAAADMLAASVPIVAIVDSRTKWSVYRVEAGFEVPWFETKTVVKQKTLTVIFYACRADGAQRRICSHRVVAY